MAKFINIKEIPEHLKNLNVDNAKFAHYKKTVYKISDANRKLTRLNGSVQTIEFPDSEELYFKFVKGEIALSFEEKEELEFVYVSPDDIPKRKVYNPKLKPRK